MRSFACSLLLPPICCIDSNCNNKQRPKLFVKIKFSLARRNVIVSMIFCSFDESMFKTDTGFLGLRLIYFKLIYDFLYILEFCLKTKLGDNVMNCYAHTKHSDWMLQAA